MSIKINSLELENVKRIKAVSIAPTQNGLTIIGGKNGQGKTSVLDSIAWALGGNKHRPSEPAREGSVLPPKLKITLSNGLVVERKGKNSDLKVTDPNGTKSGQQLLDEFIEVLALDLPKFMAASNKEKAETLLRIIGVGDLLGKLELEGKSLYNDRLAIGRIAEQKAKYAKEMVHYDNVPEDIISASELIKQQQDILARNGENARKRQHSEQIKKQRDVTAEKVNKLREELSKAETELQKLINDYEISQKDVLTLQDESTEELERNIAEVDALNAKIRSNLDKEKAESEADGYQKQYDALSVKIEDVRLAKNKLLDNAQLPLPGLSVENGELTYKGYKWDNMSGADQLKVSTAIVKSINPKCGFVLLDKLEQMDSDTLNEFGVWLEQEGLQAIATRVSTGDECSIVIEDGYVMGNNIAENSNLGNTQPKKATTNKWGDF